jgi:nitrogen fixation protein FixH
MNARASAPEASSDGTGGFRLTGRKVFAMFALGFGTIITVNLALAFNAVRTFPGLETANSYVASQLFDDRREAQEALGWTSEASLVRGADGPELVLVLEDPAGRPVRDAEIDATLGRATMVAQDVVPQFAFADGAWRAPVEVGGGNWDLRLRATAADGTLYQRRLKLRFD